MPEQAIPYTLIRSKRKTLAIQIRPTGQVEVRAPARMPQAQIDAFVRQKTPWIQRHMERIGQAARDRAASVPFTDAEIRAMARHTAEILPPRVARFSALAGVSCGRITVRSQRTRWGSCSAKENLSFNCLLAQCPDFVVDYVAAHEVCHRLEMNHSPRFWAQVERILPDWQAGRAWLKQHGQALIARLPEK